MDEAIAAGPRTSTPTALAEPTEPVKTGWMTLLFLANIGLWLAIYAPIQVLPAASDRAKDLGLINIACSLPLVVAPLVAGVVLGLMNSYPALFALAGAVTVIAGVTVSRVRSVPLPPIPNRYEAAYLSADGKMWRSPP